MTAAHSHFARATGGRLAQLMTLLCFALALTACAERSTQGTTQPQPVPGGPGTVQLAYGISVQTPPGWEVETRLDPQQAAKPALDAQVAQGQRIMLYAANRPAGTPEGRDGMVGLFLVDAGSNFPPQDQVASSSQEALDGYAQAILESDRRAAQEQKTQSNLIDWKVTKLSVDGNLALAHQAYAKRPDGGRFYIYDVNIYLPGGKGLVIKSLSNPDVAGTEGALGAFVNAIRIAK